MARKKQPAKSNNMPFFIIIGLIIVVAASVLIFTGTASGFDYTPYSYTDTDVETTGGDFILEEYSDFQCPYCQQMAPIIRQIKSEYSVHVIYKHFPLTQIHPHALTAAEASECARDQGRFWAYHDVLMDSKKLAKSNLFAHAKGLGLDTARFKTCVNNREKQIVVEQHRQEGVERGVTGTPSMFLNGERINVGSYNDLALALSGQ